MTTAELENEVRELKRRVDLAETRLAQLDGRFEFVSGQLRDIQLYMHQRFNDVDKRLDGVDKRLDGMDRQLAEVRADIRGLRLDLPAMIGATMREVLAESRKA